MNAHMSMCMSSHKSVHTSVRISTCMSIRIPVCMSVHMCIHMSTRMFCTGQLSSTPTVSISSILCTTASWTSGTSLGCLNVLTAAQHYSDGSDLTTTVAALVATVALALSFDAPAISWTTINFATSGGSSITVHGLGFGAADSSNTLILESDACVTAYAIPHPCPNACLQPCLQMCHTHVRMVA